MLTSVARGIRVRQSVTLQPVEFLSSEEAMNRVWSSEESTEYTRWLATHHYENFHVVSFMLPKRLHQDFYNVYAFCRWADDLGDELNDARRSIEMLGWWRGLLHDAYAGHAPAHPVFVALRQTIDRHRLPMTPFDNLISAFVQDQTVTRYADWNEVHGYCVNSANPVGRLVLYLCGYRDEERTTPWTQDTIVNGWSTTKTVLALAALAYLVRAQALDGVGGRVKGHRSEPRLRMLGVGRVDAGADAALLRAGVERGALGLVLVGRPPVADQLVNGWHSNLLA